MTKDRELLVIVRVGVGGRTVAAIEAGVALGFLFASGVSNY
jgi:hypothetical protein